MILSQTAFSEPSAKNVDALLASLTGSALPFQPLYFPPRSTIFARLKLKPDPVATAAAQR
jgi:hypothetical protein